ncbi:acyl-homoserine-lactone synthase [Hyphococcus luteus]|uniref:Acyl-homoserine-lactone synthase n=1 Tax=Hyphococcus luteus TaxID=2058213 RepID=A0A2S7K562_9PROT|nr:acyl-homoserine-lactone synthase [Marinicaulis flavus]PQA87578.1 autoinducer synthase [Marinicaulis flavus]
MLFLIDRRNRDAFPEFLRSMHRDRKRMFVDIFGWRLAHDNGEERDAFDDDNATYLVLCDDVGCHVASVRLLRTDRPHLLDTLFSDLCEGEVPRGGDILEITRLCLPLRKKTRIAARNILARGIIDYAALAGVASYTAVCHMAFLSELLSAGWRCTPLGLPQAVDGAAAGAVQIHMEENTRALLDEGWRCPRDAPRLTLSQSDLAA